MAIHIGSNFLYRGQQFLDERQNIAKTKEDLKNWNISIPNGFEVFLNETNEWYIYDLNKEDPETGHFVRRLEDLYNRKDHLTDILDSFYADSFDDLTREENWIKDGINYCRDGIIVTVISSTIGGSSGVYRLNGSDYSKTSNWIKLIDNEDIIKSPTTESSDETVYSSKASDKKFIRRDQNETIEHDWTFKGNTEVLGNHIVNKDLTVRGDLSVRENAVFEKNLLVNDNISAEKDLTVKENANIGRNLEVHGDSKFNGTINANGTIGLNNRMNIGKNGSRITVDGETGKSEVVIDKLTVKESDIQDFDKKLFTKAKVGVDNLIKNSRFTGEYDSKIVREEIPFNNTTKMFSDPKKYWNGRGTWNIVEDHGSITGYSVSLLGKNSELYQELDSNLLLIDEGYVLSFKAKGNITAEINGNSYPIENKEDYKHYEFKFIYTSETGNPVISFKGEGSICEPKLSKGTLGTAWFPSTKDTDPIADLINSYEYLKGAFKEYNEISNASGVYLRNMIQAGKMTDSTIEYVKAGLSGVYSGDKNSVFLWSGSNYEKAIRLISKLENNNSYIPSDEEMRDFANVVITFGGLNFINKLIAKGKFYGDFYGTFHPTEEMTDNPVNYSRSYSKPKEENGFTGIIKVQGSGTSYPDETINNEYWTIENGKITGFSLNPDGSDGINYSRGFSGQLRVNSNRNYRNSSIPGSERWVISNGLIVEIKD